MGCCCQRDNYIDRYIYPQANNNPINYNGIMFQKPVRFNFKLTPNNNNTSKGKIPSYDDDPFEIVTNEPAILKNDDINFKPNPLNLIFPLENQNNNFTSNSNIDNTTKTEFENNPKKVKVTKLINQNDNHIEENPFKYYSYNYQPNLEIINLPLHKSMTNQELINLPLHKSITNQEPINLPLHESITNQGSINLPLHKSITNQESINLPLYKSMPINKHKNNLYKKAKLKLPQRNKSMINNKKNNDTFHINEINNNDNIFKTYLRDNDNTNFDINNYNIDNNNSSNINHSLINNKNKNNNINHSLINNKNNNINHSLINNNNNGGDIKNDYIDNNNNYSTTHTDIIFNKKKVTLRPQINNINNINEKNISEHSENNIDNQNNINNLNNLKNSDQNKTLKTEVTDYKNQLIFKDFDDFSPDLWKKFYPKDAKFFNYEKGNVINSQTTYQNDMDETETYIGELNQNGEKNGFGKLISNNKKRIGTWRKNQFTGWGREVRGEGELYEGRFLNGELTGKGIYQNKKNEISYVGDFYKFMRHGKGDLYTKKFHYKGNFENNKINGKGRIEIYNNGVYEGIFKDDKISGDGTFMWKEGGVYEGEMKDGKMNGFGKLKTNDGIEFEGTFNDGVNQGHGDITYPDGIKKQGRFSKGMLIPLDTDSESELNNK